MNARSIKIAGLAAGFFCLYLSASDLGASPNDKAAIELVMKGCDQQVSGDVDGAIALFNQAIEVAPDYSAAYFNRARAYLAKGNYRGMYDDANKALELKTVVPDQVYTLRGTARAGQGDLQGAIADCNKAIEINPRYALAYNNRANDKVRLGDFDGALADCNKSIELDPTSALPYYNRGYIYLNQGKHAKAVADWNRAIQMQPGYRTELEPLVQKLGGNVEDKPVAASDRDSKPGRTLAQRLIGTWQGGRHRTQYFADGNFFTDPHLVPDPPRQQWHLESNRLIEYAPQSNITIRLTIVSLTDRQLITKDDRGNTYQSTRIPDEQAAREKANW